MDKSVAVCIDQTPKTWGLELQAVCVTPESDREFALGFFDSEEKARAFCARNALPVYAVNGKDEMRKIYCIALEGEMETGVNWYAKKTNRDAARGYTGAETEIAFTIVVPRAATLDEITQLADRAAWDKTYIAEPGNADLAEMA